LLLLLLPLWVLHVWSLLAARFILLHGADLVLLLLLLLLCCQAAMTTHSCMDSSKSGCP
jgi:hypothetical protein